MPGGVLQEAVAVSPTQRETATPLTLTIPIQHAILMEP